MKLQEYFISSAVLLLLITGCKVTRPAASVRPSAEIDMVQINAYPVASDIIPINAYPTFPDTISIIGVGDMMLGTNFPDESYLPPDSGRYLLRDVINTLMSADLTFGNLEGVLLNDGGDPKDCKNPEICYLFRMPEYLVNHIAEAGFDVLSTANNHAGDFGDPGRENTARILDSLGIAHAGTVKRPYIRFTNRKIRYGFAAFAPNKGTPLIADPDSAKSIIAHLDSLCDIVIASFHGGAEGSDHLHVTRQTEYFYGENRGNVYEFSHALVDAGADIVFGHGPHVPRAVEVYNGRFIAYSLGNFCTYARFKLSDENGLAPIVRVNVDHEGAFLNGKIVSAIQTGKGIPKIDKKNRAARLIRSLSEEDFQEAEIVIGDSGLITYIEK